MTHLVSGVISICYRVITFFQFFKVFFSLLILYLPKVNGAG